MIPIHENERLEHVDEKDGIKYFFRSLTGENESKFYEIVAKDSKDKPLEERKAVTRELVDFVLVGWESTGAAKCSPFPEDGHPSKCFNGAGNNEIVELALRANRLTVDEAKN